MMYLFSIYTFKGIKVFLYPNSILSFRKFLGIVAARLKKNVLLIIFKRDI